MPQACAISFLRESMIDSLRSRVEEKLELRGKVQQLEQSLQCREHEVADLQAKVVQLSDRYCESF